MRLVVLLLSLAVPAFCQFQVRGQLYDNLGSRAQQRWRDQQNVYGVNGLGGGGSRAQQRWRDQLNDYGLTGFDVLRPQQGWREQQREYGYNGFVFPQSARGYQQPTRYREQLKGFIDKTVNDADVASSVLQLVHDISTQAQRNSLRTGEPVDIQVEPSDDQKTIGVELQGHVAEQFVGDVPKTPKSLRQQEDEPTLHSAGIYDLVIPGNGPMIHVSIEGPLATKIRQMKMSDLSLPPQIKSQLMQTLGNPQQVQQLWQRDRPRPGSPLQPPPRPMGPPPPPPPRPPRPPGGGK